MPTFSNRQRQRVSALPYGPTQDIPLGQFQYWSVPQQTWLPSGAVQTYRLNSTGHQGDAIESMVDNIHFGPPYLSGGPMRKVKVGSCAPFEPVWGNGTYTRADNLYRYIGGFRMPRDADFGSWTGFQPITTSGGLNSPFFPAVGSWGDKAWNKTKPQLEKAGAGVFLAELRDLPRMLRTTAGGFHDSWLAAGGKPLTKIMTPKKAADHFLNHQFGWKPFVSDIRKFYNVFHNSDKIISKIADNNGRYVRRRVTLEADTSTTLMASGNATFYWGNTTFHSPFAPRFMRGSAVPTYRLEKEVTTLISAVGKFVYYRPEFDRTQPDYTSVMNGLARQATIYGLRISPSNIYKATPWTWAIDWVSNVGDYVDRINDSLVDSVACRYLYLMRHTVETRKFIVNFPWIGGDVNAEWTRFIDVKQRDEASSPYGFSLSIGNLTGRQLAIAGALGISKFF